MKRFYQIGAHANLYRLGATMLAAVVLVVLFSFTEPVNQHRNSVLRDYFSQLQDDETKLGVTVLELNFSLSNNYDQVNAIFEHQLNTVHLLQRYQRASHSHNETGFQQKLNLLEQQLMVQSNALEQFKSSNAVLKNSLIYLPNARDDLERKLPAGGWAHENLDRLVEQVLLNRIKGGVAGRDDFNAAINNLEKESLHLSGNIRQQFEQLINHIRNIDRITTQMPGILRQLSSNSEISDLIDTYRKYYDLQQQRAAIYRVFLLLATLALLVYILQVLIRLGRQASQLKLAANVFAVANEGITITDTTGKILDVNPAFTAVTGYRREEVIGKNPRLLQLGRQNQQFYEQMWQSVRNTGQWQGEIWNRRKNGVEYPEWMSLTAVKDIQGVVTNYVGIFSDISKSKKTEEEIKYLAFYDQLSGLPNRRLLLDRLHQALTSSARNSREGALLFIDLDNFKTINDTLGHYIGDLLLQQVAHRIESCVREGDTVARLGGDEFVVILEDLSNHSLEAAEKAEAVAAKILALLNEPYQLAAYEYRNTPSIGITLFNNNPSIDDLLKQADIAMYQAKNSGRNTLRFFDPLIQAGINARAALEEELRKAYDLRQFHLYYQIQVDSSSRAIGAEALIRWIHPERGLISPVVFIPVAEETGLILPIGKWVLETACIQLKCWQQNTLTCDLTLSVNVSAKQFRQKEFVAQVQSAVLCNDINPMRLKLELTESLLLENIEETIMTMAAIRGLGVRFSLDDFGTGYSSLQYLKRLPLDQLKIDQSFVRDITVDESDKAIVNTIVAMATSLNLNVIAEGVETEVQRQLLLDSGCTHYQGYLFGKPVPIDEFELLLKRI